MKKLIRLTALLLACVMIFSLVGCGGGSDGGGASGGGETEAGLGIQSIGDDGAQVTGGGSEAIESDRVLHVAVQNDSGSLFPYATVAGGFAFGAIRTIYDTLWDYTSDGQIEYLLCTGWEAGDEENEYILHLREGVNFSNGNPFTAEDVIFSMEVSNEDPQYFSNVDTVDFERTNIIDDYTIDLYFTEFDIGQFPGMMLMYIFDKESFDMTSLASDPIGTGPYILDNYVTNSSMTVVANPDYWGEQPAIKQIEFHVINEASQQVNLLTTNELDYTRISTEDVDYVRTLSDDYILWATQSGSATMAYFNCSPDAPLGTNEARIAICHAIDVDRINDVCFNGLSEPCRWGNTEACRDFEERFIDPEDPVYSVGYDPELAAQEAEAAGLVGQHLRIMTNGAESYINMAEIIQQNLQDIGIDSEIINYDQATYWGLLMDESNFDIAMYMNGSPKNLCLDLFSAYLQFFPLGLVGDPVREQFVAEGLAALANPDEDARQEALYQMGRDFENLNAWYALCENISVCAVSNDLGPIARYNDGEVRYANWYWVSE